MTSQTLVKDAEPVATNAKPATTFKLQAQLLDQGRTMDLLARTDVLAAHLKVYSEGGENTIHTHTQEDHLFVILAGEATFHLGREDRVQILRQYEGVIIPAGSYYWFLSSGKENLVLLRVGAKPRGWSDFDDRIGINGKPLPGDSPENKELPVIKRADAFFPR
jgi:mannose-6-phosphate isomerase-like protein (cupin superfamily)